MKFRVGNTDYDFDLDHLTMDEGELVDELTGYSVVEFGTAVQESRVKAMRAMVYLAKRRNGEEVDWAALGTIDLMELAMSIIELNDIDIEKAANGQNPAAVADLVKRMQARKGGAPPNRAARRTRTKK